MSNETPKTIEESLRIYAEHGVVPRPEDINAAYEMEEQRRGQLELQSQNQNAKAVSRWVDAFNRWYPRFLQTLLGIGDVLITMTQTVLIAFGVPAVLFMLLVVEQQRVYHGISLFEVHEGLAAFSAIALVTLNLILEMLISWVEHRADHKEPVKHQFSFYFVWQWLLYVTGRDKTPRQHSPAQRFKVVLRIVTFSILTLALAGSMRGVIENTSGNWLVALRSVFIDSTLLQMVTWMGGLLFAFAAVLAAQALSQYVAEKVVEIIAIMRVTADDKPRQIAEAAGMAAAYYLYSRFKEVQRAQRLQRAAVTSAVDMPVSGRVGGTIPITPVDTSKTGVSEDSDEASDDAELSTLADAKSKSKIDTAVDMLQNDRSLKRKDTRELEGLYPNISRETWRKAKKRLGIKS